MKHSVPASLGPFLARLVRLEAAALVRLRPGSGGGQPADDGVRAQAWAMLPFRVLACTPLAAPIVADVTVDAAELLAVVTAGGPATGAGLPRRDAQWRWPVPSSPGRLVETIPVAEVIRLAAAAARTVRTATTEGIGGRAVGERALRDALLDHVAIVVTTDEGDRVEIPQRMIQALVRMGLLGSVADPEPAAVDVRIAMGWSWLVGKYGSVCYRPISPLAARPRG